MHSKIDIFKECNRKEFSDKLLSITDKLKAYQKYINKEPPINKVYENEWVKDTENVKVEAQKKEE